MTNFILQTKLYIPTPLPNVVQRKRLLDRLNESTYVQRKLTLVSAPAGFGKTTVVVDWIHQLLNQTSEKKQKVAWVSLDEGDNDPSRFLAYLIAALQTIDATLGQMTLSLLNTAQIPTTPTQAIEAVLGTLINELSGYALPFLLVLDDYHVITEPILHQSLEQLLNYMPPNMHLVITSRTEPPFAIARLRARGQVIELGAKELRFTLDEAMVFVNHRMGLALSRRDVMELERRTEGWPAGLQFAALRIQGLPTQHATKAFIHSLSGQDRHMVDYLAAEVLSQQTTEVQRFLMRTSILNRMNADSASVVMGIDLDDARTMLKTLEQRNLFLIPLDHQREWFRYHHLFAELLQQQLKQQLGEEEITHLHLKASQWLEKNSLKDEAIEHALLANDMERAAGLMALTVGDLMLKQGEFARIRRWLDVIPMHKLTKYPQILIAGVFCHLIGHDIDQTEFYLEMLNKIENLPPEIRGQMAVAEANILRARGDIPAAKEHLRNALFQLPEEDLTSAILVKGQMVAALMEEESLIEAHQLVLEIVNTTQLTQDTYARLSSTYMLGVILTAQGRLREAEQLYQDALRRVDKQYGTQPSTESPMTADIHVALSGLYYEWNELDKARHHCSLGIRLGELAGIGDVQWNGSRIRISLLLSQGRHEAVYPLLAQLREMVQRFIAKDLFYFALDYYHLLEMQVALRMDDFSVAGRWLAPKVESGELQLTDKPGKPLEEVITNVDSNYLSLVHYYVLAGWIHKDHTMLQTCCVLLSPMIVLAEERHYHRRAVGLYAFLSLAHHGLGQINEANRVLEQSLRLAQPEGYIRTYVDLGVPMQTLLSEAYDLGQIDDTFIEYAEHILAAYPDSKKQSIPNQPLPNRSTVSTPKDVATPKGVTHLQPHPTQRPHAMQKTPRVNPLVEPLTTREEEILHFVAEGYSNQQVADKLIISIGTVKRHMS
ncbi:MAG: LuxR C-terminal-related transcriptional regulator, partial [Chloroflexota bacterium]